MNRKALLLLCEFLLAHSVVAVEWENNNEDKVDSFVLDEDKFDSFILDDVPEGRFLNNMNLSSGTFVTFNTSLILFSGGIILWGVAGAILLYYLVTIPAFTGTGSDYYEYEGGYGQSNEGYSKSDRRSYRGNGIDWETFTILDWIAVAEETWKKFDPTNLDCQKRLVCDLHQNASKLGVVAQKLVDIFSYLEYASILRLPEELKGIVDSYLEAADRGRSMKKDCGDVYSSCDFSMKSLLKRLVHHNEI